MKLISLLEKIGFGKYTSKEVDDVVVDKFEDFGVYVGQLYQKFLNKDVSSDPAIAQKIINMVDFGDSSDLSKEIKDLEFLVNQLPDKPEPKGKIGFREITDELYLEEDDRSKKDKEFDLAQQLSKLTKDDRIKLKKIQQMIAKEKSEEIINGFNVPSVNEEKINGFDYHYTKGTSGGTQQFGRPRIVAEKEPTTDYFSMFTSKLRKGIEDLIKNLSIDKSKGKKDKEGNIAYPIMWNKAPDEDIRKIGGDVYYGDEKNKKPVKGRQRILVPPKRGWPKKQYDKRGNFKQYIFDKENNEKIKIKEFIKKTIKELSKK